MDPAQIIPSYVTLLVIPLEELVDYRVRVNLLWGRNHGECFCFFLNGKKTSPCPKSHKYFDWIAQRGIVCHEVCACGGGQGAGLRESF